MKRVFTLLLAVGFLATAQTVAVAQLTDAMRAAGWEAIFDGRTLDGWRSNETNPARVGFRVENGEIIAFGPRNHLYFMERLTNFELMLDVNINNDGNGGIYVKSQWQENTWPTTGFEIQVNSSHGDRQRTGSLYNIIEIHDAPHADDEWFTVHIICRGNTLELRINGKHMYTYRCQAAAAAAGRGPQGGGGQAAEAPPITERTKRIAQSGHIAIQAHHDGSIKRVRNVFLRRLPD